MKKLFSDRTPKWGALLGLCLLAILLTILWLRPAADLPPSVSMVLLGYTNRVGGPYALLAITNRSESAIMLDLTCLVKYSPAHGAARRRVTSIEPNRFRV